MGEDYTYKTSCIVVVLISHIYHCCRSNEYIYDEVGPQHKPCVTNPAEPAMVEPGNITDGHSIADEDYI